MAGGVRNLRAMFENKDPSISPPADRGRSPASTGITSNGTSPRSLSKIRTSFVTVEKSGQIGLQMKRDASGEPSSTRRTSSNVDEERRPNIGRSDSLASDYSRKKSNAVVEDSIPEMDTPSTAELQSLPIRSKEVVKEETPKPEVKISTKATNDPNASKSKENSNGHSTPKIIAEKVPTSKISSRPTPISTTNAAGFGTAKISPNKSSAVPRTPTKPRGRSHLAEEPKKVAEKKISEKKPEKKATRASLAPSQPSTWSSRPTDEAESSTSKARINASPPQTGFVKPKPRSPTRPVKLPASLTAHTASSGSKTTVPSPPHRSKSRTNARSPATVGLSRSPSRVSTTSTSTKTSTLGRKPSTLNKPSGRPSLGPPPAVTLKKQPSRQSLPKSTPALADDSFLSRMMRPTASSASKFADPSATTTQPKRVASVKRPATRETSHKFHEPVQAISLKPVAKAAATVVKPVAKASSKAASSVSKHVTKEPEEKKFTPSAAVVEEKIHEKPTASAAALSEPINAKVEAASKSGGKEVPVAPEPTTQITAKEDLEKDAASTDVAQPAPEDIPSALQESAKSEDSVTRQSPVVEQSVPESDHSHQVLSPVIESPAAVRIPVKSQESPEIKPQVFDASHEDTIDLFKGPVIKPLEKVTAVQVEEPNVEERSAEPKVEHSTADKPRISTMKEASPEGTETGSVDEPGATAVSEPFKPTSVAPEQVKSEGPQVAEDPEDVKAREEIARLNAELMKAAEVDETY